MSLDHKHYGVCLASNHALFRKRGFDVIAMGTLALRFQCMALPLAGWTIPSNMLLQTIGKGAKASLISISARAFLACHIDLTPQIWFTWGKMSQPVADTFFSAIYSVTASVLKELRAGQRRILPILPKPKS